MTFQSFKGIEDIGDDAHEDLKVPPQPMIVDLAEALGARKR